MTTSDLIEELVAKLDTKRSTEEQVAWEGLKPFGDAVVPYLAAAYTSARTWQGRTALVFHSIRYARTHDAAFELGCRALSDRSYMVRYRACMVLAYSLRPRALPALRDLLKHDDARTREDAAAAVDAIQNQNHHFFVDRAHSGKVTWDVR
jgi:hypothetical protein